MVKSINGRRFLDIFESIDFYFIATDARENCDGKQPNDNAQGCIYFLFVIAQPKEREDKANSNNRDKNNICQSK